MAKIGINVYTNMDNVIENKNINAIVDNNVIKYIDSDNNKFIVDISNNVLIKENDEFIIKIEFSRNFISIILKEYSKEYIKEIETLAIEHNDNSYYVKYKLIDENIINEYKVKFI